VSAITEDSGRFPHGPVHGCMMQRKGGEERNMNLDHIFGLITFATGALFFVVFITS
jgi:hypothetical protein